MKRLLYVVLLIAGTLAAPIAPAQATSCAGVTVVVQFENGPVHVGCAPGNPSSGYDALTGAGFQFTYVTRPGAEGAICQIDRQPAAANTCWGSTYWSYWHATPGHSWSYAHTGASYDPAPGSFEGWHFGDGTTGPRYVVPPASTPKPTPTPKPSAHPTAADSNPVVKPADTGPAIPGNLPTAPDATSAAGAGGAPAAGATATASDAVSPTAPATAGDLIEVGKPIAPTKASSGSGGASWIWGALLFVVLGAAAATTAVRRRRS